MSTASVRSETRSIGVPEKRRDPNSPRRKFIPRWGALTLFAGAALAILVLASLVGPVLLPFDAYSQDLMSRNLPPMSTNGAGDIHFLGTDPLGRDLLSRLLLGTRLSLLVGAVSVLVAALIGTTLGVVAGYFGGLVDSFLMRVVDVQMSFPFLLIAIIWSMFLGTGLLSVVAVVALRGWVTYARVIRGRVLSVKELAFVEAAHAAGGSTTRILIRHVLPQAIPAVVIISAIEIGVAIMFESTLGFLGLGVQPPTPTLGNILADGRSYLQTAWWVVVFPGVQLSLIVLLINSFGDGLRDILDPRRKK